MDFIPYTYDTASVANWTSTLSLASNKSIEDKREQLGKLKYITSNIDILTNKKRKRGKFKQKQTTWPKLQHGRL